MERVWEGGDRVNVLKLLKVLIASGTSLVGQCDDFKHV